MASIIKISLAILLFLCLLHMPYGFYQLVRIYALIGFCILAYLKNMDGKSTESVIYIALALLFQPLLKISLGRALWNLVDIVVGIGLIISYFSEKKGTNNSKKS